MKPSLIIASNLVPICFILFAAYCLSIDRTGFAITGIALAALTSVTIKNNEQ